MLERFEPAKQTNIKVKYTLQYKDYFGEIVANYNTIYTFKLDTQTLVNALVYNDEVETNFDYHEFESETGDGSWDLFLKLKNKENETTTLCVNSEYLIEYLVKFEVIEVNHKN